MKSYMKPPIPDGFVHVSGTWDKGFVIEDVKSKNRFTWIPIGICNEAIKGVELKRECDCEMEGIEREKGIYISTYPIAKSLEEKAVSTDGKAWNNVPFRVAKFRAVEMCKDFKAIGIKTRLVYATEYDMIVKTIAQLLGEPEKQVTNQQFEEFGLYGMNEFWTWTMTNYTEWSVILKKADSQVENVYASNDFFVSSMVGFRIALIVF